MTPDREALKRDLVKLLRLREQNGGHLHHSACIHNLTPEEQIKMRGKTVDWWMTFIGHMPVQITSDDWQTEPPDLETLR